MSAHQAPQPKNCFVISPIGEENSDTRRRSDQVLKHIIKPSAESCGYRAIRADEIDKPGLITSQVIQRVVEDPLVIADLTETNPNVFYELAIRHAIQKPLVQIIEKGQRIPFDVAGTRTIYVDHKDLDSVSSAKDEIIRQIRELEINPSNIETPISVAHELQILRKSEDPKDRGLADLLSAISEIKSLQVKILDGADRLVIEKILDSIKRIEMISMENFELSGSATKRGQTRPLFGRTQSEILMYTISKSAGNGNAIAIIASYFKDSMPWIYEIGMEAFRQNIYGDKQKGRSSLRQLRDSLREAFENPMYRELIRSEKEYSFLLEAIEQVLFILNQRYEAELANPKNS